jgi:hypothetical protein
LIGVRRVTGNKWDNMVVVAVSDSVTTLNEIVGHRVMVVERGGSTGFLLPVPRSMSSYLSSSSFLVFVIARRAR